MSSKAEEASARNVRMSVAPVAFLCLAAHCSISGALANYVLESIVKRSRTLVFLAHMQDLRSKYEVIFVLKTRFFW